MSRFLALTLPLLLLAARAEAGLVSVAVMDFSSGGEVSTKKMEALSDLLANEIRGLGGFKVIGRADIRTFLNMEDQKQLLGCSDDSCMAEIGGALGVDRLVTGNISRFGDYYLLNLKLLDVREVRVVASVSRKVPASEDELVNELPEIARELMALPSPVDYGPWGHITFWSGVGFAALGGVALYQAKKYGDEYNDTRSSGAKDSSLAWEGVMWTGFALSAGLMAAGIVLWLLSPSEAERQSIAGSIGPAPDGRGLVFSVGGRF